MASSCCNFSTSTLISLLRIPFNTISHFSDYLAYPTNAPQHSRWIHQRGHSSPRSLSNTIQPGQTVLPVSGPSIVPANNDPYWENTTATNPDTNLTSNRSTFSTHLLSKLYQSDNTNKQLANVLGQLANTLNFNQTPSSNINTQGTKVCISDTFSSTEPNKLNNFLFQYHLYFYTNPMQFNIDIVKINYVMSCLTGVA